MPQVADSLAISAEDWRRAAAFAVVSTALDGREFEVKVLLEGLGGRAAPMGVEWIRTVERVALRVQSGEIDATWDGFLTSVLEGAPAAPHTRTQSWHRGCACVREVSPRPGWASDQR